MIGTNTRVQVDKSTLGQATLLGLFKDTGLNNSEYNNLNSLFYTG